MEHSSAGSWFSGFLMLTCPDYKVEQEEFNNYVLCFIGIIF